MVWKGRSELHAEFSKAPDVDYQTAADKKRLLRVLSRYSASYISELAFQAGMSDYQARLVLTELYRDGLVEEVPVTVAGEPRLLARVAEMSARGQGGAESFSRKKWYALTTEGKKEANEPSGVRR